MEKTELQRFNVNFRHDEKSVIHIPYSISQFIMKLKVQKSHLFLIPFSILLFPFSFSGCSKTLTEPEAKRTQIEVTGDITEDTVWESGKDYIIRGFVTVGENATLTIEKDVHVYFDEDDNEAKGQIDVRGILNASSDDSTKMIVFQSLETGEGVELQRGISLYNDYNQSNFNYCVFNYLFYGIQGSDTRAIVENCNFENCYYAINISKCDSLLISHCEFIDNSYCIKIELSKGVTDSSLKISYNNFLNSEQIAVEINNQSWTQLSDNIFESCSSAVLCQNNSTSNLKFNNFFYCDNCIIFSHDSKGNVQYNQFRYGDIFVYLYYRAIPKLNFNNFEDVKEYNIKIFLKYGEMIINAENNWWGTASKEEIEKLIFDETDDNSEVGSGTVDFEPFAISKFIENCGVR